MENRVTLFGRIASFKQFENSGVIKVAVKNDFKNKNGEYDTEFIESTLFGKQLEYASKLCESGNVCFIVGRIHVREDYSNQIIVEKISIITKQKKEVVEETPNPTFNNNELPF